jgi:hypothetical protein
MNKNLLVSAAKKTSKKQAGILQFPQSREVSKKEDKRLVLLSFKYRRRFKPHEKNHDNSNLLVSQNR